MAKVNKDIMSSFPKRLRPREVQESALRKLEETWSGADVFVVNLPVAAGKSAIAMTIAHWAKKASIITPTKMLVQQYKNEYPAVHVLRAKGDYYCSTFKCQVSKRPAIKNKPKTCHAELECKGCTDYLQDLRKSRVMPYVLSNYYIYMAHSLYRDVLIVDEAHNLVPMLQKLAAKKLWHHKYGYPTYAKTREQLIAWVNSPSNGWNSTEDILYHKFKQELLGPRPSFLIENGLDLYHGEEQECLRMIPLDIREEPPFLWPSQVKKIVLLSATISRKDIEQLGMSGRKVQYIQSSSPIEAERRPIVVPAESKNMSYKEQPKNLPALAQYIQSKAAEHKGEKGLIHVTYSLARLLQPYLTDARYIFHTKSNKSGQYQAFRNSSEDSILVAAGMHEGVDLPYDAGRWQVLAKVPWPSLAEPAIKHLSTIDPEFYAWETIKSTLQACGRICRTPEDYGITYIFDDSFRRLYKQNPEFFPEWLKSSVHLL